MFVRLLPILAVFAAAAVPAHAAPSAPKGFYGVTYTGAVADAPAPVQQRSWRLMDKNGADSGRAAFPWSQVQREEDGPFDFSPTDVYVRNAAMRGIELLPAITSTPSWARKRESHWWPGRPRDLAAYATALVARYGPDGSFWSENPDVPTRPVRHWQIFNEPGHSKKYPPLLRAASRAIRKADGGAKVVLAGLTGTPHGTPWGALRSQYRKGKIRRWFDVAALHMYTGKPRNVLEGARRFRKVMRRHGDRRKPLWITEFGITASKGRTDAPRSQRTLRTTDRGMARFLKRSYRLLVKNRRRGGLRLGRAYWHTWASSYEKGTGIFSFAGLNSFEDGELGKRPALAAYRASARRHRR